MVCRSDDQAVCSRLPRNELHGQPLGRQHGLHPFQGQSGQVLVALGNLEVLREPMEQADFFVGRGQVDSEALRFPLQFPDTLCSRQMPCDQLRHCGWSALTGHTGCRLNQAAASAGARPKRRAAARQSPSEPMALVTNVATATWPLPRD